MRLVTFVEGDKAARPGLVVDGGIVDLGAEGFKDAIEFMGAPGSVQAEAARAPFNRERGLRWRRCGCWPRCRIHRASSALG